SNTASSKGGGLYNQDAASGVMPIAVDNLTFNLNSAGSTGGAIYQGTGTIQVDQVTISGNGASGGAGGIVVGFSVSNQVSIANSIVTDGCSTALTSRGGNVDNGTTCGFNTPNNDHSTAGQTLGTLGDNGGGTQTML